MPEIDFNGMLVLIAGGSKGLGRALGISLATRGAHITIIARTEQPLNQAREEILQARRSETQAVTIVRADLCRAEEVNHALQSCDHLPDMLICTAGGTSTQLGFLADIDSEDVKSCLESNYYSAVFIVQSCLKNWLRSPKPTSTRHIVFTSSTAAFMGLPGYVAYTPAKAAVRALADTLRQELLLYKDKGRFLVHCSFPGTFVSEAFAKEQEIKPQLTKRFDGTDAPLAELERSKHSPEQVANIIVHGLKQNQYLIPLGLEGKLLLNSMRGPSPREWGLLDFVMEPFSSAFTFFIRKRYDKQTEKFGRSQ